MKTNKAFIKLNGEIGEKEIPGIEYVDNKYLQNQENYKKAVLGMLENDKSENEGPGNSAS